MKIQLQQADIIAALKMYVASRGIGLANSTVEITFTAKRKEGGLTADVDIQEALTPSVASATSITDPLTVASEKVDSSVVAIKANTKPEPQEEVVEAPVAEANLPDAPVEPEAEVEPKPKASLFG